MTSTLSLFNHFPVWENSMFKELNRYLDETFPDSGYNTINTPRVKDTQLGRPSNKSYIKDKDGNITNVILDIVYTPFKKENVNIWVEDGELVIELGQKSVSELKDDNTEYEYRHISQKRQLLKYSLAGDVDEDAITAKAEEGVLTVDIPILKENKEKYPKNPLKFNDSAV